MQDNFNLYNIQKATGYKFKDPTVIKTAFVCRTGKRSDIQSNEGLIFLGTRLLDFVLSDYIYTHYLCNNPKNLLLGLENYKNAPFLTAFISENKLENCIIIDSEALRVSEKVHYEVFLAILAAIYRDGGMPSLKAFLIPMLRGVDGEQKYAPKCSAHIELEDNAQKSLEKHIKKEAKGKISSASAASTILKAETVEVPAKADKKLTLSEKLFGKKQKNKESVQKESVKEKVPEAEPKESENIKSRSFIRDALQPVSLPEHMKNPRPKNAPKPKIKSETPDYDYQDNAKSLLQEHVQKNLRTSSVLIKYVTEKNSGFGYNSKVSLNNKLLAKSNGDTKKAAEMQAANIALSELQDPSSELSKWFSEQNTETLSSADPQKDYVTKLNEHFQKENRTATVPIIYEKLKVNEKRTKDPKGFITSVKINGVELGVGKGFTPKEAKQNAAKAACEMLNIS